MAILWAEQALTAGGWAEAVRIEVDAVGRITSVRVGTPPEGQRLGIVLPAPANLHSHAFQRAMAGLGERRGSDPADPARRDSFWTWRQLMFRFLDHLTPEDVQSIAAFVQMQMLEAGFGCNVEFHYLHHRPGGAPYDRLAEIAERVVEAASATGIGLTLLPVLYQQGGVDGRALGPGQIRFGNDPERFALLHQQAGRALAALPDDARLGVAPHSLRAVSRDGLAAAVALAATGAGAASGPALLHMHLAEQVGEVAEIEAAYGARPVRWLLDHAEVGTSWCLIHCTQMLPDETLALAASGAVAGLCPITEASLGDGIFDGVRYLGAGGRFGLGSDSNIRISLAEELRQLEYSQRLRDLGRAALASAEHSTGRRLFEAAARGGAQAAGRGAGVIAPGEWADLLALDIGHPDLAGRKGDTVLDTFAFAGGNEMVADVWSAGRHLVHAGRHRDHDAIRAAYARTQARLRSVL